MAQIKVYASEVASLVGANKFYLASTTVEKIKDRLEKEEEKQQQNDDPNNIMSILGNGVLTRSLGHGVLLSGKVMLADDNGVKLPLIVRRRKKHIPARPYPNDVVLAMTYSFLSQTSSAVLKDTIGNREKLTRIDFNKHKWSQVVKLIFSTLKMAGILQEESDNTRAVIVDMDDEDSMDEGDEGDDDDDDELEPL